MMNYCPRLIEVDLPIRRISEYARLGKNVRTGNISSLHIWWARRPLAACRAVICAALWLDPASDTCPPIFREKAANALVHFAEQVRSNRSLAELCSAESYKRWSRTNKLSLNPSDPSCWYDMRYALLDFIADFSGWDAALDPLFLQTAREVTLASHEALGGIPDTLPVVIDPFAGGGAMPLEALRVGAEAVASDLNPLAALLNKLMLEYVPRHGKNLVDAVEHWGGIIRNRVSQKLKGYYPTESNDATVIGYLWARTIVCEGPACGVVVPIVKSQSISLRKGSEAAVSINYDVNRLETRVVTGSDARKIMGGTSKRSSVTCPKCGFTTERKRVEAQANSIGFGFHLLAVCLRNNDGTRSYRQPNDKDINVLNLATKELEDWKSRNFEGISTIPSEELPYLRSIFNVRVYGINQWDKLFNARQLLSAIIFVSTLRDSAQEILKEYENKDFAVAIIESLSLSISNAFQYQCNIATYLTEGIKSAFIQGQSLPMKMDFIEANPIMDELAGSYDYSLKQHISGLRYLVTCGHSKGSVFQISALKQILPEDSIDLVATDPPYYDVVPYADCSDFFYVWLRRMLHGITNFPTELILTPKDEEIVQLAERNERYRARTKQWFEQKMSESLRNQRISTKPTGVAVIVFAHKDTAAWEALLQSVLDAGWYVTASWPIDTEKSSRLRANESAVLGSSIHLVCRPRETVAGTLTQHIGDWREVLQELPVRIRSWLPRLAQEGIVGADAIFACLGPALEIFSRYSWVEKANGEEVLLREYLEQVWATVSREALTMLFAEADASGLEADARLTAMWLWTLRSTADESASANEIEDRDEADEDEEGGGNKAAASGYSLEYDAARKIAQGLGAHLETLGSIVEIKGSAARLRSVGERTRFLFGGEEALSAQRRPRAGAKQLDMFGELEQAEEEYGWGELIAPPPGATVLDQVHQAMILFAAQRGEALRRFLSEQGVGRDGRFWRLAQALSALYPLGSDEKRWVDGVLSRKKSIGF
jgi:putative DNA methylase